MKTIMTSQITNGMFVSGNYAVSMDSEETIIESIFDSMIEPIIYKC
ncbi:hypothetical protein [Flavobacterium sp.]|nr:hypothetical protein [Flavobacterium sp.]HSD09197.1 hypothetical protein [Flavobacterium sp.]